MTTPTFIAVLDLTVSATNRPEALDLLQRTQPAVRAMPGCVAFRSFPSAETATDITVLHEWADRAAFDDYLASAAFVSLGEILRPMMTGAASSRRFRVQLDEAVG